MQHVSLRNTKYHLDSSLTVIVLDGEEVRNSNRVLLRRKREEGWEETFCDSLVIVGQLRGYEGESLDDLWVILNHFLVE